ncbi:MAG: ABC transporter permease [Rhodothermales bacterium]|nr:ABC transporter permease [Rhodothermales bacterium]MBO6780836.1 ABC transporter permease [Rhodothermales bacterium]
MTHPSKAGGWLFRLLTVGRHPVDTDQVERDLLEAFERRCERIGIREARRGYWRDLISISLNTAWRDAERDARIPRPIMLRDFLITAVRSLRRSRWLTASNLLGLTVSIACCLLLVRHVLNEIAVDAHLPEVDRTYRVVRGGEQPTQASTSGPTGPRLVELLPEVASSTRVFRYWNTPFISQGDIGSIEHGFLFADANHFEFFQGEFVEGSAAGALQTPNSVVLTTEKAAVYFGDEPALGQRLLFSGDRELVVTGVVQPSEQRSHLTWDFLASFSTIPDMLWPGAVTSWGFNAYRTYVRLEPFVLPESVAPKLTDFLERETDELTASLFLEPVRDIYLHSSVDGQIGPVSDINYVYILASIALLLVLLACINYTNLATARASVRAREVGVRKVLGASRSQVALQFLGESLALVTVASVLALCVAWLAVPVLQDMVGLSLTPASLLAPEMLLWAVLILVGVGLLAGTYPSVVMSSAQLLSLVRGGDTSGNARLRRSLVVFQFTMSIVLIVSAIVIARQLEYVERARLGFDQEAVLVLEIRDPEVTRSMEAFKGELTRHASISRASAASSIPGGTFPTGNVYWEGAGDGETAMMGGINTDADYAAALGLELAAGRFLTGREADSSAVVVNETALARFGWGGPEEALGRRVSWGGGSDAHVVGVLRDYHVKSLHEPITPMLLFPARTGAHLALRVDRAAVSEALSHARETWDAIAVNQPFSYSFLDEQLAGQYETERTSARLIAASALLTVLIACLGLLGLAAFTAERRIREIGIRKVLGATQGQILGLLGRELLSLVVVAFVLAVPVSYVAMSRWLDRFAFHTELGVGLFLVAGIGALVIAGGTVAYQAFSAARRDPVVSLRTE